MGGMDSQKGIPGEPPVPCSCPLCLQPALRTGEIFIRKGFQFIRCDGCGVLKVSSSGEIKRLVLNQETGCLE